MFGLGVILGGSATNLTQLNLSIGVVAGMLFKL